MGRVARYKKVKASVKAQAGSLYVDTHRKKKKTFKERKNKATKNSTSNLFDTAPSHGDDFDLSDPTLSVKTPKVNTKKHKNNFEDDFDVAVTHILPPEFSNKIKYDPTVSIPKSEKEEAKAARVLKLDIKNFEKSNKNTLQANNKSNKEDSLHKANRFYHESLQAMKKVNTSTHRHDKRKEYLLEKKKLSRKQKQHKKQLHEDDDYLPMNNSKPTHESSSSGYDPDTAERPPIFPSLPKGVKKKNSHISGNGGNAKELESLRERVQSQYQEMKLKRRKRGEFHL